jgi:hypothetical protein
MFVSDAEFIVLPGDLAIVRGCRAVLADGVADLFAPVPVWVDAEGVWHEPSCGPPSGSVLSVDAAELLRPHRWHRCVGNTGVWRGCELVVAAAAAEVMSCASAPLSVTDPGWVSFLARLSSVRAMVELSPLSPATGWFQGVWEHGVQLVEERVERWRRERRLSGSVCRVTCRERPDVTSPTRLAFDAVKVQRLLGNLGEVADPVVLLDRAVQMLPPAAGSVDVGVARAEVLAWWEAGLVVCAAVDMSVLASAEALLWPSALLPDGRGAVWVCPAAAVPVRFGTATPCVPVPDGVVVSPAMLALVAGVVADAAVCDEELVASAVAVASVLVG